MAAVTFRLSGVRRRIKSGEADRLAERLRLHAPASSVAEDLAERIAEAIAGTDAYEIHLEAVEQEELRRVLEEMRDESGLTSGLGLLLKTLLLSGLVPG